MESGSDSGSLVGRAKSVQDWLRGRADTALGRLALPWFRGYFAASRNSGCAATVYTSLSILPAALVAVAYFHPLQGDSNVFAQRLVTHMKLTGSTGTLVEGPSGAPPRTRSRRASPSSFRS
jgi:hypothetical protein